MLDVLSVVGSSRHVKNRYSILSGEFHQYLWRWGNINNRTGEELSVWQSGCSKWWWRHRGAAWEREIFVFTRGNVNIQLTCAPLQSIFLISSHQQLLPRQITVDHDWLSNYKLKHIVIKFPLRNSKTSPSSHICGIKSSLNFVSGSCCPKPITLRSL